MAIIDGRSFEDEVELIPPHELQRWYPNLWETARSLLYDATEEQVAVAVNLARGTCGVCHDASSRCRCWNDE